ncbi:MAG: fumarylacetoacetate hydrolase family protein [Micrococcales bacterium]|nr:fumarylacetoacetate hydrolase family protein [Micrococcales bacterium]
MRLARLGERGAEVPVVLDRGKARDLRPVIADIDGAVLSPEGLVRIRSAVASGALPELPDADGLRIGSPLARPGTIVCIGQNYAAHAAESGSAPPEWPIVFFKSPNAVSGPNDPLPIPPGATTVDWEVELGVVIGTRAWQLDSPAASADHIAGYVLADDVSERTWQRDESGGQWGKGKSAPGFCPLGPWLATADELDATNVRLRSFVDGQPRQDSTTADLIFPVAHLVHHLSHYLALEPGDLLLTGTPEGVALSGRFPYLAVGDVLELEIDGLGRQRQELVAS